MKKNIIIGILVLITITLVLFAFIKASDAGREFERAEALQQLADETTERAQVQEQKALDAAMVATKAAAEVEATKEALRLCQEGK